MSNRYICGRLGRALTSAPKSVTGINTVVGPMLRPSCSRPTVQDRIKYQSSRTEPKDRMRGGKQPGYCQTQPTSRGQGGSRADTRAREKEGRGYTHTPPPAGVRNGKTEKGKRGLGSHVTHVSLRTSRRTSKCSLQHGRARSSEGHAALVARWASCAVRGEAHEHGGDTESASIHGQHSRSNKNCTGKTGCKEW